ncbi:uncharacterized protein [Symphalangus syndactylus]|uniref:uncharacterized protein n=1 Tax=Symphalangus syndactylus TaxID=9590 RepID=UPI003004B53A
MRPRVVPKRGSVHKVWAEEGCSAFAVSPGSVLSRTQLRPRGAAGQPGSVLSRTLVRPRCTSEVCAEENSAPPSRFLLCTHFGGTAKADQCSAQHRPGLASGTARAELRSAQHRPGRHREGRAAFLSPDLVDTASLWDNSGPHRRLFWLCPPSCSLPGGGGDTQSLRNHGSPRCGWAAATETTVHRSGRRAAALGGQVAVARP